MGSSTSRPRNGRNAVGTTTEPSACWWFSRIATIVRGMATSVPFSVAAGADAVAVAHPNAQPAGLELGAVRGRRHFAVLALRRYPRFAVVLARSTRPEVAGSDVDHAVRHLERVEELPLPRQQSLMLGCGVSRIAEGEHLDLVELVNADDALGVLAVRAGLPAKARGEPGIPQRQLSRRRGSRPCGTPPAGPRPFRPGSSRRLRAGTRSQLPGRGSRCPSIARERTNAGGSIGMKPAATACWIAMFTSASSSRAPTPVR